MFQKFASFFFPINIHKQHSVTSKCLELNWNNGKLVLDSKNTNYSYGSLQRILKKGLRYIGFERIKSFKTILVLGVAGGSVIETLLDEIGFAGEIVGVEIDSEVLILAKKYFGLGTQKNVSLINEDAFDFILRNNAKFDLIIIDVFQDTTMPNFLFQDFFIEKIKSSLQLNGFILFNTMVLNEKDRIRNIDYKKKFIDNFSIRMYPKVEEHNELFTIKRLR